MARYVLAPSAEADIEDIWEWIALEGKSPASADALIDLFFEKFPLLATQPRMGVARPWLREDIRAFPVKSYIIFYRVIEGGVEIERVIRASRNIEALFDIAES
jgi:toxin ParE1/3/4